MLVEAVWNLPERQSQGRPSRGIAKNRCCGGYDVVDDDADDILLTAQGYVLLVDGRQNMKRFSYYSQLVFQVRSGGRSIVSSCFKCLHSTWVYASHPTTVSIPFP